MSKAKHDSNNSSEMLIISNAIKNLDSAFYSNLSAQYKSLSPLELKLCVMLRSGYSKEDVLIYSGLTAAQMSDSLKRISNILKLKDDSDLIQYLSNINFNGVKNEK